MSGDWRTVKVFISSTFRDMHSERDWLVKRVFPALRERLEKHRVHLVDIDLRWGVTREQSDNDQALDVCLAQIDECRPFFLGILGERYGYVSRRLPDRVASRWGWVRHHTQTSITELEILHGVLNDAEMHPWSLFCFRDPAFLDSVPPTLRVDLRAEDGESARKLAALKAAIEAVQPPLAILKNYPCRFAGLKIDWRLARLELNRDELAALERLASDGLIVLDEHNGIADDRLRDIVQRFGTVRLDELSRFGQVVQDWLWGAVQRRLNLPEAPLAAAEPERTGADEAGFHARFIESRTLVYVGRESVLDELTRYADGDETAPCLVTGESGSGKSAALARFVTSYRLSHPGVFVVPHFIGASPASTSLRQTLHRFCLALKVEYGFGEEVPPDTNTLITTFRQFVGQIPTDRRVVLVIDALNQFDEGDYAQDLYWLPWQLPAHVKLVASCILDPAREEPALKAFEHRPHRRIDVPPLTEGERRAIIREVPSLSAKTLDDQQVRLLLSNPATDNPLYLLVALEELRGFGSYEQLRQRMARMPRPAEDEPRWERWLAEARAEGQSIADEGKRNAERQALDIVEATFRRTDPVEDPLTAIFLQVIDRLESDFNAANVGDILSLLASARRGLSDRELLDLIEGAGVAAQASSSDLFPVLRQLRPYLQHRGELWDFFHRNLFKAVREHYLPDDESRSAAHAGLGEYFKSQDYFVESLEEQRARARRLPPTPRPANVRKVDELPWQLLQVAKLSGKDDPASPHWDAVADLFTELHFLEAKAEAAG